MHIYMEKNTGSVLQSSTLYSNFTRWNERRISTIGVLWRKTSICGRVFTQEKVFESGHANGLIFPWEQRETMMKQEHISSDIKQQKSQLLGYTRK